MQQHQQQPPHMMNAVPPTPPHLITTEQIQKYLDENKNLILAIMENQNLGKMAECAKYQAVLQKNLMYLAAIADAQPPGSLTTSQAPAGPQGMPPMLHPQAPMMLQQAGGKSPFHQQLGGALRPQEQQQHYQLLQMQQQHQHQQLQASQFGMGGGPANEGSLYVLMQPGLGGGSMAGQQGAGNSGLGNNAEGRN